MKVFDVMTKDVEFVSADTKVKDLARLIFGRGINGVPVCKEKKVVGFITERDILAKFFPSMQEYMEDSVHSADFERMEKKIDEILALPTDKIMSKNPVVVMSDTPLLRSQSSMLTQKVGRLPVVDEKGNLVGIISMGDIFKSVVGEKLPLQEEEGFYDWMAKRYDIFIDWKLRLSQEIPDLESLFKKEKATRILDIASSTGEHLIALAKRGFEVVGVESSGLMDKIAQSKKNKLSKEIQTRLSLLWGNYDEIIKKVKKPIDIAIFMGNALLHVQYTDKNILKHVVDILREKHALMVFQIINLKKIFQVQNGFRDFTIRNEDQGAYYKSHAFFAFYTKKNRGNLTYTRAIFSSIGDDGKWSFTAMNSTPIVDIEKEELEETLNKLGFMHVSFYGSAFNGPLFQESFKSLESDWLNVVARR